jgi:probable phosphoglycerate mutase
MARVSQGYHQRAFVLPPDATEVILIRHGASAPAIPGTPFPMLEGHSDPPLAPEGEAQAQAVGERLAGEDLGGIFITGLLRTVQTAAPLAERLGLEPEVVPQLREVHLGEWEGGEHRIRVAERDPIAMQSLREERWDVIPGAERMEEFAARVRSGLERVVQGAGPGRTVAAVAHGGTIAELCRQATGSTPFAFVHVENGSITRLVRFGDGRLRLRSFNETAHLP